MYFFALLAVVGMVSAGTSHIAWGFNFDELHYTSGSKVIQFHNGRYEDPQGDLPSTRSIEGVIPGVLSGSHVAVVLERGEGPGGYDESADVYRIEGGKATDIGGAGDIAFFQTGTGPWPEGDNWYAFRFSQGRLYADIWHYETRCDRRRDWIVTTYALRSRKLVAVNKLFHHRAGAPVPHKVKSDYFDCTYGVSH